MHKASSNLIHLFRIFL